MVVDVDSVVEISTKVHSPCTLSELRKCRKTRTRSGSYLISIDSGFLIFLSKSQPTP